MKQVGDFKVDTRNAGSGELKVVIKGPSESKQNICKSVSCLLSMVLKLVGRHHDPNTDDKDALKV